MNVPVHHQRSTVVLLTKPKQTLHHLCLVSVLEKMKAFCLFGRAKLTLNTAPPSLMLKVIYLSLYDTTQEGRNSNCYLFVWLHIEITVIVPSFAAHPLEIFMFVDCNIVNSMTFKIKK